MHSDEPIAESALLAADDLVAVMAHRSPSSISSTGPAGGIPGGGRDGWCSRWTAVAMAG
jgi:hypothetical protein